MEFDAGRSELANEGCSLQSRKPRHIACAQAILPFIRRFDTRLENVRYWLAAFGMHPYTGERIAERPSFVGAVEYLPVAELTSTAETDASGADSTQRIRDHGEGRASKPTRVSEVA